MYKLLQAVRRNLLTIFLAILALLLLLNPDAKALAIQGLVKTGLTGIPHLNSDTTQAADIDLNGVAFKNAAGETITLGALKGKTVFINFWATWCQPCRAEMPSINTLAKIFSQDTSVVFMMVNADGETEKSARYFNRKNIDLPVYVAASALPSILRSQTIPATYVIDRAGHIKMYYAGAADYANKNFVQAFKTFVEKR